MIIKGFDKFLEKTPMLRGKRLVIIPFYVLLVVLLISFILNLFYSLPDKITVKLFNPTIMSLVPLLGFLGLEFIGFFLFSQIWLWRNRLKQKYGQLSYQKIIFIGLAGVATNIT